MRLVVPGVELSQLSKGVCGVATVTLGAELGRDEISNIWCGALSSRGQMPEIEGSSYDANQA